MPGVSTIASQIIECGARLDHGKRDDVIVGFTQIDRLIGQPGQRGGAMRSPAPFADRGIFGRGGEGARVGGGIDHRGNDAFSAEVESARDQREIADRHAHDRRSAALAHGGDPGQQRSDVPKAVLRLQHHRREAFARQRFADDRIGQAAPAAENGFAGAQRAGESEGWNSHSVHATLAGANGLDAALFSRFDVGDGLCHQLRHHAGDLVVGLATPLASKSLRILPATSCAPSTSPIMIDEA